MTTAREQELLDEIRRLSAELKAAEEALTDERFKDVTHLPVGTEILVPRKLFGKIKWWPARVSYVHRSYYSGISATGEPWENKVISYSVYLQQPDGEYGGSSVGFYAHEIQVPASSEEA
jgi:hypothetical protein